MTPDRTKAARELLAFYLEAGADALLGEEPVDRFAGGEEVPARPMGRDAGLPPAPQREAPRDRGRTLSQKSTANPRPEEGAPPPPGAPASR